MTKIKIDVAGWDQFNGYLGTVEFANGVSVNDVAPMDIKRIGANIKVVEVDTDEQVGPSITMVNARHVSANVEAALQTESEEQAAEPVDDGKHTQEALEALAEKGGIKAIRKIAAEYGVKGVSIQELINEILEAQKAE